MRPGLSSYGYLIACVALTGWLAGCATERLDAAAPTGVNLTGEWKLNVNLSDDPDKLGPDPEAAPQHAPEGHRGHGGGRGGGGMPPMGSPDGPGGGYGSNFRPIALGVNSPEGLSITQKDHTIVVKVNMADGAQTVDEYTAGTSVTIPYGKDSTAERVAGWRGPVFVVTTTAKKGPWREDDFAIDEDGRLIMTTQAKGRHRSAVEIKRVFDRVRGVGA